MTGFPSIPATALPMRGLSWFAVEPIASFLSGATYSHAQPDPKRDRAAFANSCLNLSNEVNVELIAAASAPLGAPPLPGPRTVQKNEWLLWPPALLRRPVRIASGTFERSAIRALTSSAARAGWPSSSLVAFVMYAWWCFVWWISIVLASIWGARASYA